MTAGNKYESSDDVGFIGVAEEQTKSEAANDAKRISDLIRKFHAGSKSNKQIPTQPAGTNPGLKKKMKPKLASTK